MKILLIVVLVALMCAASAYAAVSIRTAVTELDAPGTFYQNKVELADGTRVNCIVFREWLKLGGEQDVGLSCDFPR